MRALTLNELSYVSGGFDQTEDPLHPDMGLPGQGTSFGKDSAGHPDPQNGCKVIGASGDVLKKTGPEGKIMGSLMDAASKACNQGADSLKQGISDQDKAERCMEHGQGFDNDTHTCK